MMLKMRILCCLSLAILAPGPLWSEGPGDSVELTVMTFNIRVPVDEGENSWENRRERVVQLIREYQPDFVGTQEAVGDQAQFMDEALEAYHFLGRGRESDGTGSGVQIYYRHGRWEPDPGYTGDFQLSDTPDVPGSNTWGLLWKRMTTWARFIEKESGRSVYHFNTHLDVIWEEKGHKGGHEKSVRLIAAKILDRAHSDDPVILTGDFNAGESSRIIRYLQEEPLNLVDTFRAVNPEAQNVGTRGGFPPDPEDEKIDYIFVSEDIEIRDAEIVSRAPDGAPYPSDHFAVIARIRID